MNSFSFVRAWGKRNESDLVTVMTLTYNHLCFRRCLYLESIWPSVCHTHRGQGSQWGEKDRAARYSRVVRSVLFLDFFCLFFKFLIFNDMHRPKQPKQQTSLTATLYFCLIKWFLIWTWILSLFNCAHWTYHHSDVCACLCLFKSYSQNKKTNTFTLRSWANRLDTLFPPAAGWMIFNSLPIINKVSEGTYNIYVSMYSSTQNLYLRPCFCFFEIHSQNLHIIWLLQILFNRPLCCLLLALYSHGSHFFSHSTQGKKCKVVKKKKPTKSEHSNQQLMLMFITMILALRFAATSSTVREGPLWPWYEKELIIDEKPFCQ